MVKEEIKQCKEELEKILVVKSISDETFNNIINLIISERKKSKEEVLSKIQKEFEVEHFCSCGNWCECWQEFKDYVLKED